MSVACRAESTEGAVMSYLFCMKIGKREFKKILKKTPNDFQAQEKNILRLLVCSAIILLQSVAIDGDVVLKFFDMNSQVTRDVVCLLASKKSLKVSLPFSKKSSIGIFLRNSLPYCMVTKYIFGANCGSLLA